MAVQARRRATEANMQTDRKVEKYLGPVVVVVALMMNPIPAIVDASTTNGPRTVKRSERKQKRRMMKKQKRYGGADSPLDWIRENEPISEMIVGRKRGRDAKETLLLEKLAGRQYT